MEVWTVINNATGEMERVKIFETYELECTGLKEAWIRMYEGSSWHVEQMFTRTEWMSYAQD